MSSKQTANPLPRALIDELITLLEHSKPESLIYCSEEKVPALDALQQEHCRITHLNEPQTLQTLPRFQLGVIFDFLENHDAETGTQLLGRLRNFHCDTIWVAVTTNPPWSFNTMIGLGFKRSQTYTTGDTEICTYQYDIASYNHKRSWNNPRYWANPENWGKYRW
ncbi:hypothetical protein TDB9533_00649 [Thalassocella blandensis]|nr:hypothetical protein TDB9533_00649 [Thalassocella blandensis]